MPVGAIALLAGGGPALTVQTARLYDAGQHAPTEIFTKPGWTAAVGAEALVGRAAVRFEAEVFARATRVDLIFGATVGLR
jgi:hypothetical protein